MDKLKVVWLCHLTNDELDRHFGIEKDMCAFWMTQFINIVKGQPIELHVVTPNYYTNENVNIQIGHVFYHLYKYYSGIGNAKTAFVELAIRNERPVVNAVGKIVNNIKPDIVHLFGAENITYSKGILPLMDKYPTIVSFQGYIQLAELKGSFFRQYTMKCRVKTENEILRKCPNISFGEFEGQSRQYYIEKYNTGKVHTINFPFKVPAIDASKVEKEYDIVFWGRVTVDKGVEDLINAVEIVKRNNKEIKCLILGGGSSEYRQKLDRMVTEKDLEGNIIFGGFQKTNEELFGNAAKAKIYVLPTHYDALPGSIREGMYMKLPVISYPVGDIPQLNKNKDCVLLAEYLDIKDLASKIEILLHDDDLTNKLIANSYSEVATTNDTSYIANQFMETYRSLIKQDMQ